MVGLAAVSRPITVVTFRPELAAAFAELNRAWIEEFFRLEAADAKLLDDPGRAIVDPGGQVFFAIEGDHAVGTAAAIRVSPTTYELGKMAVRPSHQGQGLGERLGRAVIDYARAQGATCLYLETNSRLANAIRLYQRLGFAHSTPPHPSDYARADVYMEVRFDRKGAA